VRDALPDAEPFVSHGMPAFRLGKVFLCFAAFRKHIGIYPPVKGCACLQERLAPYRGGGQETISSSLWPSRCRTSFSRR